MKGICPVCQQSGVAVRLLPYDPARPWPEEDRDGFSLREHPAFGSPCEGAGQTPQAVYDEAAGMRRLANVLTTGIKS